MRLLELASDANMAGQALNLQGQYPARPTANHAEFWIDEADHSIGVLSRSFASRTR